MRYVLALDQGTTSSRAIVFDREGRVVSLAQKEFEQIYPQPGWVEHSPEEIWASQVACATEALDKARLSARDIAAIGIANQRETTILWDRRTGEPVCNAIVWQDRRTSAFCDRLKQQGHAEAIQRKTGLVVDAYFSATKIAWILENVPGARERALAGQLAFGTVDAWLIAKLTGHKAHVTDVSNASRTMLLGLTSGAWDTSLCELFDIPEVILPEVRSSSDIYATVSTPAALQGIPIAGIAGDQQAALFGQACWHAGLTKNTYGTGCFLLEHTGEWPVASRNRLLTTIAWKIGERIDYALEGSVFIGGAVVQWLRDGLGVIRSSPEVEPLAASVADSGGVFFVPAFAGLGAPHWDQYARGTITGITRGTTAAHIARAAVDSIAFQVADVLEAMKNDGGPPLSELRVDGGASRNNALLQFQADILQVPVVRPESVETTALGAAYLGGLAVGFWRSRDEIASQWRVERRFEPRMPESQAISLRDGWREALSRAASRNA